MFMFKGRRCILDTTNILGNKSHSSFIKKIFLYDRKTIQKL